jgi:hypothetical protein
MKINRDRQGKFLSNPDEKHPMWKGEKASYSAFHHWINHKMGKAIFCALNENHKNCEYEWANISGKYLRDTSDYVSLCVSCHKKLDMTTETREKNRLNMLGRTHASKTVTQFSLDGKLIKKYKSRMEASRLLGILPTSIANVLSGRSKTAGGYIWS